MKKPKRIDLTPEDLDALLERVERGALDDSDYEVIRAMAETIAFLSQAVDQKGASIKRLLKMIFGGGSEKTAKVLEAIERAESAASERSTAEEAPEKPRGHGRNGATAYTGAERVEVRHELLRSGEACPECKTGKVYEVKTPGVVVRVTGEAPLKAKVWELEKLRCNLCGEIFTAKAPEGLGQEKYDARAASMIALLKYGSGLPFNRLENLQGSLGVPLPAATQWEILERLSGKATPAYEELCTQAAAAEVIYNDDTGMKILSLMKDGKNTPSAENPKRTGVYTSGVVSTLEGRKIALYFTGRKHAGENLASILQMRRRALRPPIQMSDGLAANTPGDFKVIISNCLAHGRRRFVDVIESFPTECARVLEVLSQVYKNDAFTKRQKMSQAERLEFHRVESAPLMDELKEWMERQFTEKKVEPNSGLGEAITYMLKRWENLTRFLREPNAPLDNNICERALKKAILRRKNSLFYKTERGAYVGDLFMSLIQTCHLAGANPYEYLTALAENAMEVRALPARWMPWNYPQDAAGGNAENTLAPPSL